MTDAATFSLVVGSPPPRCGFLVAAGLADTLALLDGVRFTGDVCAVPDGHVVFAGEPLLEVTAPAAEAELVTTALLDLVSSRDNDAPRLRYELVAYADQPVMALFGGHANLPGAKQVFRDELTGEDILALRGEPAPPRHTPLLRPVVAAGRRVACGDEYGPADDVAAAHRRCKADLARLPEQRVPTVSVALRRLHDELYDRLLCRQQLGARVAGARMLTRV